MPANALIILVKKYIYLNNDNDNDLIKFQT